MIRLIPKKLHPLLPYMKKYWRAYALGGVCVLANNGFGVFIPQVIRWAANGVSQGITRERLLYFSALLLAVAAAKGIFQFLTRWVLIGVSREVEFDLRNALFAHLERLSYSYFQRTRTGDIMARATNDLNAVRMLLGPAIMYSANTIVFTLGALFFMIRLSPKLTLFAFLPLPLVSITLQYFGRRIHDRFERIQAMFSEISARVQENFSGARVIRAYAQEEAEIAQFERANLEYIARNLRLVRLMGMLWPALELMLGMGIAVVLWVGGREVLLNRMSVGDFVAYTTYMMQLTWPIIALGWVINIFQRGTASMGRLAEIYNELPQIQDTSAALTLAAAQPANTPVEINGALEFRNLNFFYGSSQVLHDVSLSIPAGSSLAIVGPTGSGKTTLVSLIPRIFDTPTAEDGSPTILLDGRALSDFPLSDLRRQIGFVPQETFLFSDSIRENIAFGTEAATDEQIRAAAEAASIAADIEGFPRQYETVVGERGITLSGGQKQRTAIARALIRDPRILILDDALASVDTQTEDRILNHLREMMRDRTTIFISHRVSTIRNADQIAVLHSGRVVELGTHESLLARNGYYTDLYNKQLLEEELATV